MEYKDLFEKEIISRTLKILQDYSGQYEKTLLLNCCIGLIITPKEALYDKLPMSIIDSEEWGINKSCIKVLRNKSVKNVVRHMRNAISHNGISYSTDNGKEITHISLIDKYEGEVTFKIDNLEVKDFEKFIKRFANWALENLENVS